MSDSRTNILLCTCEGTMSPDADAIRRGCPAATATPAAHQLCRSELSRFKTAASDPTPLIVGCTQETAVFSAAAEEVGRTAPLQFVNIRESAGWSSDAAAAGPKMAALVAAAAEPMPDTPWTKLESAGVILIYGRDEQAIEAGQLLKGHLDITVVLTPPAAVIPPRNNEFPVTKGRVRAAKGHLGAFEVTIDEFAQPAPSSRGVLAFGPASNGAVSHCDIILDLSGGGPLFTAPDLRDGYLRADPGSPAAVLSAVLKARDLVGSFDKPHYIAFRADLCAHARSKIVGCTRCLELCPAGAITPAGDHVAIDPNICAGCGQCAAACPTGAAAYTLPSADALMRKLRTLLLTYHNAGGRRPIVLLHDEPHGAPLIDALARFGDGLPANVLPLSVNEVTQVGLESVTALMAYGATAVRFLLRAQPRHDISGLHRTIATADSIFVGLGFGAARVATLETDDPEWLAEALRQIPEWAVGPSTGAASHFLPMGEKRQALRFALRELHRLAPAPVDLIPLPAGAPFGAVEVDAPNCTLCLSCVSACPTGALRDDPDQPMLRFAEEACVQCGLCQATCPEKVITLRPRLNFRATSNGVQVLKAEEPFRCVSCHKPFGVKSTIEKVLAKLEGKHWMFKDDPGRLELIKMCEECRVTYVTEREFDPHATPRPTMRTTDDYLRDRDRAVERNAADLDDTDNR
jgi:ferredoxin